MQAQTSRRKAEIAASCRQRLEEAILQGSVLVLHVTEKLNSTEILIGEDSRQGRFSSVSKDSQHRMRSEALCQG
jgi:hypothetical protein